VPAVGDRSNDGDDADDAAVATNCNDVPSTANAGSSSTGRGRRRATTRRGAVMVGKWCVHACTASLAGRGEACARGCQLRARARSSIA